MPSCMWCGESAKGKSRTVEHILPRALGGTDAACNLGVACQPCNGNRAGVTTPFAGQVRLLAMTARRRALSEWQLKRLRRAWRTLRRALPRIRERQLFWVNAEMRVLGWSPSATAVFLTESEIDELIRVVESEKSAIYPYRRRS